MDIKAHTLETPTPIEVWQLPRRFDAVTWFVRLQREDPDLLHHVRVSIPQTGPSLLQVQEGTRQVKEQLGFSGETFFGSGIFPWHGHDAYLESLGAWTTRHPANWPATAAITWVMCLHREAWLALASTWLPKEETSWVVKSAWLALALGSADVELLGVVPEGAYEPLHAQVYADEALRSLNWLEKAKPEQLDDWLQALSKRSFFKTIWSRLPLERRLPLEERLGQLLVI